MATKTFYVTRDMRHPFYKTRMLRAGDQLDLDRPTARLYAALKAISPNNPRTVTSMARPDADGSGNLLPTAPTAPKPRRAPGKRASKKTGK